MTILIRQSGLSIITPFDEDEFFSLSTKEQNKLIKNFMKSSK